MLGDSLCSHSILVCFVWTIALDMPYRCLIIETVATVKWTELRREVSLLQAAVSIYFVVTHRLGLDEVPFSVSLILFLFILWLHESAAVFSDTPQCYCFG